MLTKQLSVFLENKTGNLTDLTRILANAGINMSAYSLAESTDFGILRVIVSEPERALALLKENRFAASLTDVICICVPNEPGGLANILELLGKEHIYIDYMYAFSEGKSANVIIRPDKLDDCLRILQKNKVALVSANELYQL
jgi:hypothetical protein